VEFEDRETLEEVLSEQIAAEGGRATRVHIVVPLRGEKRSLLDLAGNNAKQSYDQRFRVMKPNTKAIQEALQDALGVPELPRRIECFDISHIQGAETVASMVVWEDGHMKKSDYRKFIIRSVDGVDDFASMREVVTRRYKRLQEEKKPMPSLVLIDGGLGQLHAAAEALASLEIINQPLAAIAKREEIIYVFGQESEPVVLDHHSPVLHLIQLIRDEAHRFAVTFHRKRRQMRDRSTELLEIPGVGARTTRRLLEHFGSVQAVKQAEAAALSSVVTRAQAEAILGTLSEVKNLKTQKAQKKAAGCDEPSFSLRRAHPAKLAIRPMKTILLALTLSALLPCASAQTPDAASTPARNRTWLLRRKSICATCASSPSEGRMPKRTSRPVAKSSSSNQRTKTCNAIRCSP
jgi:excinuclease ABC subunit C